jgi:uncharacterized protein (TIGR02246 family)
VLDFILNFFSRFFGSAKEGKRPSRREVVLSLAASTLLPMGMTAQNSSDETAITELVAARSRAWTSGDQQAYARLLTTDADIASATGRTARGRDAVIQLYKEQRAGAYAGAALSTRVTHIRMIRPDVALVDADYELAGLRSGSAANSGKVALVVVKQPDRRWLITAIRGIPSPRA